MAVSSLTYLQTSITASYINLAAQTSFQAQFMTVYQTQQCPIVQFESITKVHVPNSNTLLYIHMFQTEEKFTEKC